MYLKKQNKTGHCVYSTFSTCPVFINKLMVSVRTRLRVGDLLLRYMRLANISIYTVINIHDYREMADAGAEDLITSLVLFSTLTGPCRRFPARVEAQTTTSSELPEEVRFDTGPLFKLKTRELLTFFRNSSATMRALALTDSFISLISLSISSMKWMTKSTSLCLYICSVWKLVIRKLISYPCSPKKKQTRC